MITLEEQAELAAIHYQSIRQQSGQHCLDIPVYPLRKTEAAHSNQFRNLLLFCLLGGNNDRTNYRFIDVDMADY